MAKAAGNPEAAEKRYIVRAGLFVALGLSLAALVILLIGKERQLFDKHVSYRALFNNVDGLKMDAPIRLGGLEVGRVSGINFAADLGDKRIVVTLDLPAKYADRVRADSVARVTGRGVLGDKAIDVSLGSPESPAVPPGGEVQTGVSGDITTLLKSAGEVMDNAIAITRELRAVVAAYAKPEVSQDATGLLKSLRHIAGEIESGDGALHALIYDARTSQNVKGLVAGLSRSAARLDQAIDAAEDILREVRDGRGPAHALFYDGKAGKAISELGGAASELAILIRDARNSENGAVHQLVYGDARGLMSNLGQAAADVKAITGKIREGEGSLGAVINDPTVYEDLKQVLGNVKRNWILRELVRIAISNGENFEKYGKPEGKAERPAQPAPSSR